MAQEIDTRLVALEISAAHQAQIIDEMSAVITEQWQTIERMQKKLDALGARFVAMEEQDGAPPENTKPPHW
jgi:SlyX protein